MNYNKFALWAMAGILASGASYAANTAAVSIQEESATQQGKLTMKLDPVRFTRSGLLETKDVPLTGWKVIPPPGATNVINPNSLGLSVKEGKATIGGREVPTLVITARQGNYTALPRNTSALIELDFPFDAREWNILSFRAKVETTPEDLGPKGFGMDWPRYGLDCNFYAKFVDSFGVDIYDGYGDSSKGYYDWAAYNVPKTFFPYHHVRRDDAGLDGFKLFQWDMANDDRACNKSWFMQESKKIRIFYENRRKNFKPGEFVTITIADMQLVKGGAARVDDHERYSAWLDFVENYEPDYSDSSEYLQPPKEGRIAKPVRLAQNGKSLAEIVVDLTDSVKVENWVKEEDMQVEHKVVRGTEFDVAADAARELKLWLDKITTADFPIVTEPSKDKKPRIFLGASYAAPYFKDDLEKLGKAESIDGFAIREKDGNFYIFGVTPNGTRNGVYTFLEKNTDWIWAFYARSPERDGSDEEQGAVYTKNPNLTAVWGDAIEIPVFISRNYGAPGRFKNRMRLFQYFPVGGHILSPQYYDWTEGTRTFNPILFGETEKFQKWAEGRALVCPNTEGWEEYMKWWMYDKRFAQAARWAYMDGLDDNYGYCNCEKCTAPFVGKDGRVITPMDFNEFWSSWLFRHYNKMADERAAKWPGYESGGFCYFMSAPMPAIEVSANYKRPWICTYVRKSQVQPIFAPLNQHWWKNYLDWTAHSPNCQQYDYYMLFSVIHPIAEVQKFDLMAMRDIHFLRAYSEGNTYNEFLGMADERWCISQLYWNPDADVEQLHRYFNRRVYREAAPWIDKFRGAIRTKWYKEYKHDIEFDDKEGRKMIDFYGMDAELRGYLREAYKAAKHPKSKYFVAKMAQEYVKYMNNGKLDESNMVKGIPVSVDFPSEEVKKPDYVRPARINHDQRIAQIKEHTATYEGNYPLLEEDLAAIMNWAWSAKGTNEYYTILRTIEGHKKFGPEYKVLADIYRAERELQGTNLTANLKAKLTEAPLIAKASVVKALERRRVPYGEIFADDKSQEWFEDYLKDAYSHNELARRRVIILGYYANLGKTDKFIELYNLYRRNQLATVKPFFRGEALFSTLVANDKTMDVKKAVEVIDNLSIDLVDQAIGWTTDYGYMKRAGYLDYRRLLAFERCGKPEMGVAVIEHYREKDAKLGQLGQVMGANASIVKYWQGALGPVKSEITRLERELAIYTDQEKKLTDANNQKRIKAKLAEINAALRTAKAKEALYSAKEKAAIAVWNASLEKAAKEDLSPHTRGQAKKQLIYNNWDKLSRTERIDRVDELIADIWQKDELRHEMAKRIRVIYTEGETVDWASVERHLLRAITMGNWGNTAEYTTRSSSDRDYRLDLVIAEANAMKAAGQKGRAINFLKQAGNILQYQKGNETKKPFNVAPQQFLKRLERFDKALQELMK